MVGIDISDRSIKIAELTDEEQPRLMAVGWQAIDVRLMRRGVVQDVSELAAAVKTAMANAGMSPGDRSVVASIPEMQSFVRVLEVPQMLPNEMEEAVQWVVRQHIPFDPERVYLDWQPVLTAATKKRHQQVLVGAVRRDVVDPLLTVLEAVGLEVVALELEAQAVVRSLLPRGANEVAGILLIDIGATNTNVVFFDRGAMRFTASILRGGDTFTNQLVEQLSLSVEEAAEQKALVGAIDREGSRVGEVLREVIGSLIDEVGRAVRQMLATEELRSEGVRVILLSGGSANLPGINNLFSEVWPGVPVQLGNPWTNLAPEQMRKTNLSKEDALHFTTAFGLGLRRVEEM
jgi:type IV pilus assembly protein PilM